MPTRTRVKSAPYRSITEATPRWPPAPPRGRTRMSPGGKIEIVMDDHQRPRGHATDRVESLAAGDS